MNPITYRITLDLAKTGCQHVLSGIKVGDSNRRLEIRLTKGGVPYSLDAGIAVQIRIKRPGGTDFTDLCEVYGNTVLYEIDPDVFAESGEFVADFEFGDLSGESFSAPEIMFLVYSSVVDDSSVPEDQYNSLIRAIAISTGKAIEDIVVDEFGNLIISLNDSTEINAGSVVGPQGPKGDKGDMGDKGDKGDKGEKGDKGRPGKDVDYSLVANALKGSASGNPLRLDDVSPLEHEMTVALRSKNLCEDVTLNGSTITGDGATHELRTNIQAHFPDGDVPVTVSMKFTAENVSFSSNGLLIFCGVRFADGTTSYLGLASTDNYNQGFGSFTVNKKIVRIDVSQQLRWTGGTITIDYIQIEEGTTATAYTPFVDITGKKVYGVGDVVADLEKGIFDFSLNTDIETGDAFLTITEIDPDTDTIYLEDDSYFQGKGNLYESFEIGEVVCIGFHGKEGCVSIGKATVTEVPATLQKYGKNLCPVADWVINATERTNTIRIYGMEQGTYTVSGYVTKYADDTSTNTRIKVAVYYKDGSNDPAVFIGADWDGKESDGVTRYKTGSFTTDSTKEIDCFQIDGVDYSNRNNANRKVEKLQLETGSTATEFEPYIEPTTYTADENGKVGVPSLYPTTTLMAGDGVIISAEHNKDTNKVLSDLYQKIADLSAAVLNL